ncbi:MAG: hypothetical protein WBG90_21930 [Saonia sp.]
MEYMTTGELLFPILEIVSLIFFFSIIAIPFFVSTSIRDFVFPENKDKKSDLTKARKSLKKLAKSGMFRILSFMYLLVWPIMLMAFLRQSYLPIREMSWLVYLLSIIWLTWMIVIIIFLNLSAAKAYFKAYMVLAIFLFSTVFISYTQTVKSDSIYKGEKLAELSFVSDYGSFRTNDTILFVGKTKDYIFFRDLLNEESIVYNMGSIDNLTIHWNENSIFFADIGLSNRNWDNHPLIDPLRWNTRFDIEVYDIKDVQGAILVNREISMPWFTHLSDDQEIPSWIRKEERYSYRNNPTLKNVKLPFRILKNDDGFEFLVVKDNDSLRFVSKPIR